MYVCVCARAGVNMYYISISLGVGSNISIKINTSVKKRMDWYNNATSYNDSHIADSEIEEYSLTHRIHVW